eukprot:589828-Amorphochlora_amoeboformis.AAC.1
MAVNPALPSSSLTVHVDAWASFPSLRGCPTLVQSSQTKCFPSSVPSCSVAGLEEGHHERDLQSEKARLGRASVKF